MLALVQISLAFLTLSLAAFLAQSTGKVALGWFVLNFLLLTTGELCLAPVGLSMVTQLAPRRIIGVMMGIFPGLFCLQFSRELDRPANELGLDWHGIPTNIFFRLRPDWHAGARGRGGACAVEQDAYPTNA